MSEESAIAFWRSSLKNWAIPEEILRQAPESPWTHLVEKFTVNSNDTIRTPSIDRALEALYGDSTELSVLDVGCGGGRASYALVPPATHVVGVDQQPAMLAAFVTESLQRGVAQTTVVGTWPEVSTRAPQCDIVICHHVLYNVQDIAPFVMALNEHARRRVVIELTESHPLAANSDAWKHFWKLDRPSGPTVDDALSALRSIGCEVRIERFQMERPHAPITELDVKQMRIQMCLTPDKDDEIRQFLTNRKRTPRKLATIWWDVQNSH
ncbi:MAG: class I SAM-dependent methyltransferase [Ilumatobacteraceae bacterium]